MAQRVEIFDVECPLSTPVATPIEVATPFDPGLVEAVYYPNAYHSFDSLAPDRSVFGSGSVTHHLGYDPAAAPDAEARTKAFFDKYLR